MFAPSVLMLVSILSLIALVASLLKEKCRRKFIKRGIQTTNKLLTDFCCPSISFSGCCSYPVDPWIRCYHKARFLAQAVLAIKRNFVLGQKSIKPLGSSSSACLFPSRPYTFFETLRLPTMPFFINLTRLIAFAVTFSCVASLNIPVVGSIDLVKDKAQYQACKDADPKTTVGSFFRVPLHPDSSY